MLEKLYDEVFIPEAVYQEATVAGKPHADTIAEWAQGKVVEIKSLLEMVTDLGWISCFGALRREFPLNAKRP